MSCHQIRYCFWEAHVRGALWTTPVFFLAQRLNFPEDTASSMSAILPSLRPTRWLKPSRFYNGKNVSTIRHHLAKYKLHTPVVTCVAHVTLFGFAIISRYTTREQTLAWVEGSHRDPSLSLSVVVFLLCHTEKMHSGIPLSYGILSCVSVIVELAVKQSNRIFFICPVWAPLQRFSRLVLLSTLASLAIALAN